MAYRSSAVQAVDSTGPSRLRASARLALFAGLTLPLMPVQELLLRLHTPSARRFPHWYHRQVCRVLGVRVEITGAIAQDRPVLIVANHVSWLDIVVLSAVAPVSFVAKKDVASWPFVKTLARLQRTIFVDREKRATVGDTANEILARLASGDAIVLFAEGTSSDGNRILPFKTSLFAAVKPSGPDATLVSNAVVQPLSIVYARRHGLPLGWAGRRAMGYYGDIGMGENALAVLGSGPLCALVRIGPPVPLHDFADRKDLARRAETYVRTLLIESLRE
jgi:lyso-ornithine lipid O-acyltransferase